MFFTAAQFGKALSCMSFSSRHGDCSQLLQLIVYCN